jgi:hypothetical protein
MFGHTREKGTKMSDSDSTSLPLPTFAGGTKAITTTPIVGAPSREFAEMYVPGEEPLEDGELRVTVLGSGNPYTTRAQAFNRGKESLAATGPCQQVSRVRRVPVERGHDFES